MVNTGLEILKNKRILITGHTGFKGTWMTGMLLHLGAIVAGYSLPVEKESFYEQADYKIDYHVEADIRDTEAFYNTVRTFQPEIIIHLASHSSLDRNYEIPHSIIEINTMGTLNVLETARKVESVRVVLVITSDKSYAVKEKTMLKEDDYLWATDPYSASKVCQELIAETYRSSFFENKEKNHYVAIATARASNVIGGGDFNQTRLIPYLLSCYKTGNQAKLRNPKAIRPWQSVLDVIYGYLKLVVKLYEADSTYCTAYNFGPAEDGFATVEKVAKSLVKYFPDADYIFERDEKRERETAVLQLDSSKAERMLSWEPYYSFEDIIKQVADFEKDKRKIHYICNSYISEYLQGVSKIE